MNLTGDCRYILGQAGVLDSVYLSHSNNHGSQTVQRAEVETLFRDIPRQAVIALVHTLRHNTTSNMSDHHVVN